jgi:demethylmenaquinone methyltransferase/2-methoxy-6-polyprenyl-1,4-benzoquinol methylase
MDAQASAALFDRYAADYDRVNGIISLGLDTRWRRWVASRAVTGAGARVLDAFAGTGLVGIEAGARGAEVVLADTSERMLAEARRHAEERHVPVSTVCTDLTAGALPFASASFDAITLSFGIRYLDEPAAVLRRLAPLLAPGGGLVVLEFVRPEPGPLSSPAALYFFRVLPRLAARLAHQRDLYDYLARSTLAMGHASDLVRLVESAGYDVVERRMSGFGIVAGLVCLPSA